MATGVTDAEKTLFHFCSASETAHAQKSSDAVSGRKKRRGDSMRHSQMDAGTKTCCQTFQSGIAGKCTERETFLPSSVGGKRQKAWPLDRKGKKEMYIGASLSL